VANRQDLRRSSAKPGQVAEKPVPHVTVCACTYRRPDGLQALLEGLAAQRFRAIAAPRIAIVIADNEGSPTARAICEQFQCDSDIALTYVHEPCRGISFARNACLDRLPADSDFFAMIDDDEVPEANWLEELLRMQQATDADVVKGPMLPVYPDRAAPWIEKGGFFGWPSRGYTGTLTELRDGQPIAYADTNNVLVRTAAIRELGVRFHPRLALTGGESGVFFDAIKTAGFRMVYAANAVVRETIPPERATLRYLCRIAYRIGNNRMKRVLLRKDERPGVKRVLRQSMRATGLPAMVSGLGWILISLGSGTWSMDEIAVGVMRAAYGLGRLTSLCGLRYEHYQRDV
jgi:glycosyltransferase involved in cell wall biosynthesis